MDRTEVMQVFVDDEEKLVDMLLLSKEEWLASYGYMTEAEWDVTAQTILEILRNAQQTNKKEGEA